MAKGVKAFILAAGAGTRLRPLTNKIPKALIAVGGKPMLERILDNARKAGVSDFVVNIHFHAEKIARFCTAYAVRRRVKIELSWEKEQALETGGGLRRAAAFLHGADTVLIHNVDVLTELDLRDFLRAHTAAGNLATLSCRKRESTRGLLFDRSGHLAGHRRKDGVTWAGKPLRDAEDLAFDGISAIAGRALDFIEEDGVFSLTHVLLRWAQRGFPVGVYRSDRFTWRDIGTLNNLQAARTFLRSKRIIADG